MKVFTFTKNGYKYNELTDEAKEKVKRAIRYYINNSKNEYTFDKNNHYCYSCKFIDKKYIDNDIAEFIDYLNYCSIRDINEELITRFFNDMIDYFQELDEKWEKAGYEYFYEIDDESIIEWAEANGYYFDEDGEII